MGQAPLSSETALALAHQMIIIPGVVKTEVAMDALANLLVDLCKGAELDGQTYSAEQQAAWLVREAVKTMRRWPGGPGLSDLLTQKFYPAATPSPIGEKPAINCIPCGDWGFFRFNNAKHVFCECEVGVRLRKSYPQFLERLNPKFNSKFN